MSNGYDEVESEELLREMADLGEKLIFKKERFLTIHGWEKMSEKQPFPAIFSKDKSWVKQLPGGESVFCEADRAISLQLEWLSVEKPR